MIKGLRAKTTETDRGYKKFKENMKALEKGSYVKVGFPVEEEENKTVRGKGGEIVTSSDLTVAAVATFNEFGTDKIPERSFIRAGINEKLTEIKAFIEGQRGELLMGSIAGALGRIGTLGQNIIQKKIQSMQDPANAPSTVLRKGSSHPLIDTGQMVQSVRYVVVLDGEKPGEG